MGYFWGDDFCEAVLFFVVGVVVGCIHFRAAQASAAL